MLVQSSQGVPTERWAVLPFDQFRDLLERAGDLGESLPYPTRSRTQPPDDEVASLDAERAAIRERWLGPDPPWEA